jgi:periplasmic divalent cation tolerance protein
LRIFILQTNIPGRDVAVKIAEIIVEKRLAACANVLPEATSIYWWEKKLQREIEYPVVFKTTEVLKDSMIKELRALHPHDVPEIVFSTLEDVDEAYANWIIQETKA